MAEHRFYIHFFEQKKIKDKTTHTNTFVNLYACQHSSEFSYIAVYSKGTNINKIKKVETFIYKTNVCDRTRQKKNNQTKSMHNKESARK